MRDDQDKRPVVPLAGQATQKDDASAAKESLERLIQDVPPDIAETLRENLAASAAKNTQRAYNSQWRVFQTWCRAAGLVALPVTERTLVIYITWLSQEPTQSRALLATPIPDDPSMHELVRKRLLDERKMLVDVADSRPKKVASIAGALAAIAKFHEMGGHVAPSTKSSLLLKETWRGIRRRLKVRPQRKKPLLDVQLKKVLQHLGTGLERVMRKAMILVGWSLASRRSELVSIQREHVWFVKRKDGRRWVKVFIPSSKADQEGKGDLLAFCESDNKKVCPVRALKKWLRLSGIKEGPVFRAVRGDVVSATALSDRTVSETIKRAVEAAGLDPDEFAGHSLRSGFATSSVKRGVDLWKIKRQTRHQSLDMLGRYLREADPFKDNPTEGLLDRDRKDRQG